MQHVSRFTLTLLLAASLAGAAWAKDAEYKRSDANFYWKGDVLKVNPNAVILTQGTYKEENGSYFTAAKKNEPKEVYVQVINDWVEPITPPDMPASLGVAPDAMQIREVLGDVQVALPASPTVFAPASNNMDIPNGAVLKTGANGSAAVLMGGVNSIRLVPNSQTSVQQAVTADSRATVVNLTAGAVFSKVGKRIGEKQDYQVKTPNGVAAARGTDFVTVALPVRTDVWIAQGTVQLDQPDGKLVGSVSSEGTGGLKIIRFPLMPNATEAMTASSQTMTMAMDFIPTVNLKLKALKDKLAGGGTLTANEKEYLKRIRLIPCLIKLALVVPPPAPVVPPPAALPPIDVNVRTDGKVDFQGATLTLVELKAKLADLGKATPHQPIVVKPATQAEGKTVKKIQTYCETSKLKQVTVDNSIADKAAADKKAADKAAADKAAADKRAAAEQAAADKKAATEKAAADKIAADKAAADKKIADKAAADKAAADKKAALAKAAEDKKAAAKAAADKAASDKAAADKIAADKKAAADKVAAEKKAVAAKTAEDKKAAAKAAAEKLAMDKANADKAAADKAAADKKAALAKAAEDKKAAAKAAADKAASDKAAADKIAADKKAAADKVAAEKKAVAAKTAEDKKAAAKAAAEKLAMDKANADKAAADKKAADKAAAEKAIADKKAAAKAAADKIAAEAKLPPIELGVHADGKVEFQGATLTQDELKPKLEEIAKNTPGQPIVIVKKEKLPKGDTTKIVSLVHSAKLTSVTVSKAVPTSAAPAPAPAPATPTPPPANQQPPAMDLPLNIEVLPNGKVKFDNATYTINELKPKAHEVAKSLSDQAVVIKASDKVSNRQIKKVVAVFEEAKFKSVTVAKEESKPSLMATRPVNLAPLPPPSSESSSPAASDDSAKTKHPTTTTKPAPTEPAAPFSNGPGDTVP